ncbi:MAG: 2,3-bisphosphoglycerate-independent phosphoglycerate mutase, partial [Clostridia bacterium]|nr:2,3-bisphosphoglycerate-independent phosphoglycerate mutase [Clostridia bacterium]
CIKNNSDLHIMGLLSDGGVHSHIEHLYAIIELAKRKNIENVYVHCFLDGRDVSPTSGASFAKALVEKIRDLGKGQIATVIGRYYAMDRDSRWERVSKAYDAIVNGVGQYSESAVTAIENSYNNDVTDEFVVPTVITTDGKPNGKLKENDSVVFFNFRPDRAREITRTIVDEEFSGFERKFFKTYYVCMTQYDASMPNVHVAFKPQTLVNTLGETISKLGLKQLRIAETEKYAHVTFFFNGGVETVYEGEDRILVSSPKVATYDMQPEMSAYEVTDKLLEALNTDKYDVVILNFANCDMVGHTGDMEAAVKAVEAVDECIGKVYDKVMEKNGVILITADHGNAEQMVDPSDKSVFTAHTTNVVPLVVAGLGDIKLETGRLADLAPTMLDIMNVDIPEEMTGKSLITK